MEEINEQIINITTKEWLDLQTKVSNLQNLLYWLFGCVFIVFICCSILFFMTGNELDKLNKRIPKNDN